MELLSRSLTFNPSLHVLTGPVNSGKSLMVEKLIQSFKSAHVPVTDINLRGISFNCVDSLVTAFKEATDSWLEQFLKAAQHFKLDAELYGFKIKVGANQPASSTPITRLNSLLQNLQKKTTTIYILAWQKSSDSDNR